MKNFPPTFRRFRRPTGFPAASWTVGENVQWDRPLFRAPQLVVRPPAEPLPFTVARVTAAPRQTDSRASR